MKGMAEAFYEKFKSQALTIDGCDLCPCKSGKPEVQYCNFYNRDMVNFLETKPKWCKVRHIILIKER